MTDSKPGPLPQKSGALPMKLPQETYTTITLIQIIELLTAKSLNNCVELQIKLGPTITNTVVTVHTVYVNNTVSQSKHIFINRLHTTYSY